MAGATLTGVSAFLNLVYGQGVTETLRRDAILPNVIPVRPMANSSATWRVKIGARNTAAAKAQGYAVQSSDYSTDTRLQAILAWAHYEAYASVTGTAQRIAAANSAYNGMPNLIDEEVSDAAKELAVKISADCYAGDVTATPVQVAGVAAAIDSTGTYAGIDPSTYTTWVSGEDTSLTTTTVTLDAIRRLLFRPVKNATGRRPDMVTLPGNLHDIVAGLVDPSARLLKQINSPLGQVDLASMGFTGFMLDGVPFVEDRHATSNSMYAWTLDECEFQQVPPDWTSMDPGQIAGIVKEMTGQTIPLDLITSTMEASRKRLSFQINALAKDGDSTKLHLVGDFQLCIKRRNAFAKLTIS